MCLPSTPHFAFNLLRPSHHLNVLQSYVIYALAAYFNAYICSPDTLSDHDAYGHLTSPFYGYLPTASVNQIFLVLFTLSLCAWL